MVCVGKLVDEKVVGAVVVYPDGEPFLRGVCEGVYGVVVEVVRPLVVQVVVGGVADERVPVVHFREVHGVRGDASVFDGDLTDDAVDERHSSAGWRVVNPFGVAEGCGSFGYSLPPCLHAHLRPAFLSLVVIVPHEWFAC